MYLLEKSSVICLQDSAVDAVCSHLVILFLLLLKIDIHPSIFICLSKFGLPRQQDKQVFQANSAFNW